jgi:hypothetical protein
VRGGAGILRNISKYEPVPNFAFTRRTVGSTNTETPKASIAPMMMRYGPAFGVWTFSWSDWASSEGASRCCRKPKGG